MNKIRPIGGYKSAYRPHPGRTLAVVVEWPSPSRLLIGTAVPRSLARRI